MGSITTINLTKTKEIVVKGKAKRPLPTNAFDIKEEAVLKLLGVSFHSNPTTWDKQIGSLLGKEGRGIHILRVCKKYGFSIDSLQHLFHSLIIPLFTYGISVWSVASYDKYLSKVDKFQRRAVRFGFLKEATPILSLLEASDNKLRKNVTNSAEGPLVDLLPPSKTRSLRNRGHSQVIPQLRTERFKRCFIKCIYIRWS